MKPRRLSPLALAIVAILGGGCATSRNNRMANDLPQNMRPDNLQRIQNDLYDAATRDGHVGSTYKR